MRQRIFWLIALSVAALAGCGEPREEVAAKYTEEVALAIIDGSWHIAGAIIIGAIIAGILAS